MRLILAGLSAVACVTSGCASDRIVGGPNLQMVENGALPEPGRQDFLVPDRTYIIGPADQLAIDVLGLPELSARVTVDSTGGVSLPLAGMVHVSGMTIAELTAEVGRLLRQAYIRDPRVAVNVTLAASQVVTVDGAVQSPGIYPIVGRMSLMRAIARASGTTEFSRENYVVVFREISGVKYAGLYDLRAIRQGEYKDPDIYSNDVVVVGESRARRIFKDILAASPLLSAPIIALLN